MDLNSANMQHMRIGWLTAHGHQVPAKLLHCIKSSRLDFGKESLFLILLYTWVSRLAAFAHAHASLTTSFR
jgi:hypothetical protein